MEKRIGAVLILVHHEDSIARINSIISRHSESILGRQGIPLKGRAVNVISLVLEADSDLIGSLTGKLGRLPGVRVKSVMAG